MTQKNYFLKASNLVINKEHNQYRFVSQGQILVYKDGARLRLSGQPWSLHKRNLDFWAPPQGVIYHVFKNTIRYPRQQTLKKQTYYGSIRTMQRVINPYHSPASGRIPEGCVKLSWGRTSLQRAISSLQTTPVASSSPGTMGGWELRGYASCFPAGCQSRVRERTGIRYPVRSPIHPAQHQRGRCFWSLMEFSWFFTKFQVIETARGYPGLWKEFKMQMQIHQSKLKKLIMLPYN
jgi:hypothetical protein